MVEPTTIVDVIEVSEDDRIRLRDHILPDLDSFKIINQGIMIKCI